MASAHHQRATLRDHTLVPTDGFLDQLRRVEVPVGVHDIVDAVDIKAMTGDIGTGLLQGFLRRRWDLGYGRFRVS